MLDRTVVQINSRANEGRKEMFYLTTHSTHFIYGYMASDIIMLKYHTDSERGKPAAATWATLSDYQQGFFYMHHPTDRIAHTTAFVTPVVEHWLEREIAQWVHPMKDRSDDNLTKQLMKDTLCCLTLNIFPLVTLYMFNTKYLSTSDHVKALHV